MASCQIMSSGCITHFLLQQLSFNFQAQYDPKWFMFREL